MITITNGEWIADLGAMTCTDYTNNIVVIFVKEGKSLRGKIKNMPIELFGQWAASPNGVKNVEKVVMEAQEVFTKAYIENDFLKKQGTGA